MQIPDSVVIIGAGLAGQQLAASLRQAGYQGGVSLLGEEQLPPYQRPPLSKGHLAGYISQEELFLEDPAYYSRNAIDLRTSTVVSAIDRQARRVRLANGTALSYGHLVLATGAQNRKLPPITASSDRILQLRSARDSRALQVAAAKAKDIIIIGGGFIGLEVAATLGGQGRHVTVIETLGRLMDRSVSSILSRQVRRHHEAKGVEFQFNRRVATVEDNGADGFTVCLDDRTILHADAVLCAIGVQPRTELAQAAGLSVANGIVVDAQLRTSDPAISAIGDCCTFPNGAGSIRLESVNNAVAHANYLAAALSGAETRPYAEIPTFWSEQGGLLLQIVGLTERSDHSVLRGDPEIGAFSIFRFREDRLVAVESVNRGGDHMLGRRLLANAISPTPEEVQDSSFDLRSLLAPPAPKTTVVERSLHGT